MDKLTCAHNDQSRGGRVDAESNQYSRRDLIKTLAASALVLPAARAESFPVSSRGSPIPVVSDKVPERFGSSRLSSQRIGGLFAERMNINVERGLLGIDRAAMLAPFRNRPRVPDHGEQSVDFTGEYAGKFLDAASRMLQYADNAELRRAADEVARELIATQEADGYLGTFAPNRRWTGWDIWVHKYDLIGLLSYYEATGDRAAMQAARKVGNLLADTFGERPDQLDINRNAQLAPDLITGTPGGIESTSVLEAVCALYRHTGDAKFLSFAKYIVRAYAKPGGPDIINSPIDPESIPRGKAYEMMSNYVGCVDLYRLTGDEELLNAVLRAWEYIRRTQLYMTGTVSSRENFQPEDRLLSFESSHVGETCATVTWLQLNLRLLRLTGEARYGQEIERTVYNQLLAAQDVSGGGFTYFTSFNARKKFTKVLICCTLSGNRGIALLPQLIWGLDGDRFVVNLYSEGETSFEVNGTAVRVEARSQFPLDGRIVLTVSPKRPTPFTVRLRVPEWADDFEVISGATTTRAVPGQMLDLTRNWLPDTVIEIRMGVSTRVISGGASYPDYIALQRGPQVLALEGSLNPEVPYLHRCAVPVTHGKVSDEVVSHPDWQSRRVYAVEGLVGRSDGATTLKQERARLLLVPFADCIDHRVWLLRPDRFRTDIPAVTAFAEAVVLPDQMRPGNAPWEFVTDEDARTYCKADPRSYGEYSVTRRKQGERGGPVSFIVKLRSLTKVSRIVFRHAPSGGPDGWFDPTVMKPKVEILRTLVRHTWAVLDTLAWEQVALLYQYAPGETTLFEINLPEPMEIGALRVWGRPAGDYVTCAELAAYA